MGDHETPAATLTTDRLTPILREHVHPDLDVESVTRAPAGNGQEIWLVQTSVADTPWPMVVRRSAEAGPLRHTDRVAEADVLQRLADTGLPVPRVYFAQPDAAELDRPYLVMERLPGRPLRPRTPAEAARVASQLGTLLGRLHTAKVSSPVDVRTEQATDATREQLRVWRRRYETYRPCPVPIVGALLAWLEVRVPEAQVVPTLLWGDAGPHNLLTHDGDVTAMLDWELSHAGDPLEDLGAAVWACLGEYPAEDVVSAYESVVGHDAEQHRLRYYTVMCCVTRCIMQLAGVDAYVTGRTHEPNLAGLGLGLYTASLRRAAACADWPTVAESRRDTETPGTVDELRLRPDVGEILAQVASFLDTDVVDSVTDRRVGRGVKTAVALLRTADRRAGEDTTISNRSLRRLDQLARDIERAGLPRPRDAATLEQVAETIERDERYEALRTPLRRFLLDDLTDRAGALSPLHELYGATLATPEVTR